MAWEDWGWEGRQESSSVCASTYNAFTCAHDGCLNYYSYICFQHCQTRVHTGAAWGAQVFLVPFNDNKPAALRRARFTPDGVLEVRTGVLGPLNPEGKGVLAGRW